jgi:hypothetical protein
VSITVMTPSTYSRGGLGSQSSGNVYDEAGVIACIDSSGRLLVHGKIGSGTADDPARRELERYDPGTDTWTTLAASNQYQLGHGWIIDSSDRIIYAGGRANVGGTFYFGTDRGEIYDPGANTWTSIAVLPVGTGGIPGGRRYSYFFKDGSGQLNVIGGLRAGFETHQDAGTASSPTNGWIYSGGSGGSWTEIVGAVVPPFLGLQRTSDQDVPYDATNVPWFVDPGRGQGAFADLWYWNGTTFTQVASRPAGEERGYAATPAVWAADGMLYVAGGQKVLSGTVTFDTTWRYDPVTDAWTQLANTPRRVAFCPLISFAGYLYLVGGRGPNPWAPLNYISRYDPATDVWVDTADVLSVARAYPSIVRDLGATGFWIYGGTTANWGVNGGYTNVLEYWVPEVPGSLSGRRRSWATVIGD